MNIKIVNDEFSQNSDSKAVQRFTLEACLKNGHETVQS